MLCDVSYEEAKAAIVRHPKARGWGTSTKQVKAAGKRLGYEGEGTKTGRLVPLRTKDWTAIPDNSLVKIRMVDRLERHWVVWRKGSIYDPARGVFKPRVYDKKPSSYLWFTPAYVPQI
jgi:hypothetical protein